MFALPDRFEFQSDAALEETLLEIHGDGRLAGPGEPREPDSASPMAVQLVAVVAGDRAAIVDTGPNTAVPLILAALEKLQIAPDAVEFLFLTHVHLDHAGGAGALMRALPRAICVVHPRGAPHMIDPGKLIAGTRAVYGDELFSKRTPG